MFSLFYVFQYIFDLFLLLLLNKIQFSFSFSRSTENDFICDCRMSWLIDLRNHTKNEELRAALNEIECLLKKQSKESFNHHKSSRIDHNTIERPHAVEEEPEYYDDEPDGKTVRLMQLKPANLTCPEEASDPTELPLSRESIGFDINWVKVLQTSTSSSSLRNSISTLLLLVASSSSSYITINIIRKLHC